MAHIPIKSSYIKCFCKIIIKVNVSRKPFVNKVRVAESYTGINSMGSIKLILSIKIERGIAWSSL